MELDLDYLSDDASFVDDCSAFLDAMLPAPQLRDFSIESEQISHSSSSEDEISTCQEDSSPSSLLPPSSLWSCETRTAPKSTRKKLTLEQKDEVVDMRRNGKTRAFIAKYFGISVHTVKNIIYRAGKRGDRYTGADRGSRYRLHAKALRASLSQHRKNV